MKGMRYTGSASQRSRVPTFASTVTAGAWRRAAEAVDKLELRGNDAASRLSPGGSGEDAAAREAWGQLRTVRQLLQADARCFRLKPRNCRFRARWPRPWPRAWGWLRTVRQLLQADAKCAQEQTFGIRAGRKHAALLAGA